LAKNFFISHLSTQQVLVLFLWPKSEGMHVPVAPMPEPGPVAPPSEEEPDNS